MGQFEERRKTLLEKHYKEIKQTLDNTSRNYGKSSQFDIEGMTSKNFGRVLTYLAEEEIIDSRERSGPTLYDFRNYEPSDLEKLKEEELE